MCGIAGMIHRGGITPDDKILLREMSMSIKHRGPDGGGEYFDGQVGLMHRRLSIIDVSEKANQPMSYMDRYTIVFNGEIYNYVELKEELKEKGYRFQTSSDTEVLIAAYDCYGKDCLRKMNGMWAFLLYDRQNNEVFLSRDRFGVKPLLYYRGDGYILFASEIKAILCDARVKRVANDELVYDFLVDSLLDHTDETFFEEIHYVPASSYACLKLNDPAKDVKMDFQTYYTVDFTATDETLDFDREVGEFRNTFADAVEKRLRSDVSVGTCLSGGLDSSSIVTEVSKIYAKKEKEQHTFSFCPSDERMNEKKYIEKVLEGKDIKAHFITDADFTEADFETFVDAQDEPFPTMSMFAGYLVYREASRNGIKVLLDGQGADEILCGYRKSRIYYLQELLEKHKYLTAAKELLLSLSQIRTTSSVKSDMAKVRKIFSRSADAKRVAGAYIRKSFADAHRSKPLYAQKNFQDVNVKQISLPGLLRYVDRNAMSVSVESRLPFLDYRLVDLTAKLPLSMKLRNGYSKYIMRRALDMPKEVRERRDKFGFVVPEKMWLAKYSDYFKGYFAPERFRAGKYIDGELVRAHWDSLIRGADENLLFRMVSVAAWMERLSVESVG